MPYKEVFPLIRDNRMWFGPSIHSGDRWFGIPDNYPIKAAGWRVDDDGRKFVKVKGVRWFTNLEHGRRHEPLQLMTMEDNLRYSRHRDLKEKHAYQEYDNYHAIEVPYTDAIPSDYDGIMGVPISFLDTYCPEQFELVDANDCRKYPHVPIKKHGIVKDKEAKLIDKICYPRILIRKYNQRRTHHHPSPITQHP